MPGPHFRTGLMVAVYSIALAGSLFVLVLSWRRRAATPTAAGLALAMAGTTTWTVSDIGTALALLPGEATPRLAAVHGWFVVIVVSSSVAVAGFWWIARAVSDPGWRPSRRTWLLAVHPLLVVALALADRSQPVLVREAVPPGAFWPSFTYLPGFWVHTVISYGLLGWGTALVVRTFRGSGPLERRQAACLLAGALVPLVANVITLSARPGTLPELTAVAFTVTGAIDGYALLRHGLLRLVPVARGLVFDRMRDAVFVIDPHDRLLDVNAAGERLLRAAAPGLPAQLHGIAAADVLPGRVIEDGLYPFELDGTRLVVDLRVERIEDARGRLFAQVLVARDVTEVHLQREALDRLRADLAEQAVRDELTGLHNRRYLVRTLDVEVGRALRTGAELWVAILDVDHFKSVNDRHGHPVGDLLLAGIARALAGGMREDDAVARYGGEEFVVLLPGVDRKHALARVEEWRRLVAGVAVPSAEGPVSRTVSLGAVCLSDLVAAGRPVSATALLQAADQALYRAKLGGRDRAELGVDPAAHRV